MTEVATLSPEGWVKSPTAKLDTLFADFLAAANSQYPFGSTEVSLTWLLARHQNQPRDLEEAIQTNLQIYFSKHFPDSKVEVNVTVKDPEDGSSKQSLHISAIVQSQGQTHQLNEAVLIEGIRVVSFAKANNQHLPYRG